MTNEANDFVQIRISKDEKEKLKEESRKAGFDNMSTYIKWILRQAWKGKDK